MAVLETFLTHNPSKLPGHDVLSREPRFLRTTCIQMTELVRNVQQQRNMVSIRTWRDAKSVAVFQAYALVVTVVDGELN